MWDYTMSVTNEHTYFQTLLRLQGKRVMVGLRDSGKRITGELTNVMFDSFLVREANSSVVVAFDNVLFLDPIE